MQHLPTYVVTADMVINSGANHALVQLLSEADIRLLAGTQH
jgi:hypothetical protein